MFDKIKKNISVILLVLTFIAGLSLLLYPTVSNWWNQMHSTRLAENYASDVSRMSDEEYESLIEGAQSFNEILRMQIDRYRLPAELSQQYEDSLNIDGDGMIGLIEIPSIQVKSPIYHGTSDQTLQHYIGHLEGTSLPIGGIGTHAVLSGHRGLASAMLFTDLDKLTEGDYFMITVLDNLMTYQIDQIKIVLPSEMNDLIIESDKDLVTLVTCTPYGVNTHRILVRGHRVDNLPDDFVNARNEAIIINRNLVAIGVAVVLGIGIVAGDRIKRAMRNRHRKQKEEFEEK